MSQQKDANLDSSLDEKAPPTLYFSKLTPDLANAALNLAVDFGRRSQAPAIKAIATHPISISTIVVAVAIFGYIQLGEFYRIGGLSLIKGNLDQFVVVLIFATGLTSFFFMMGTYFTNIIRENADAIAKDTTPAFGLDLTRLAMINPENKKLDKESKEILAQAENTNIALYRETPIALVSISPVTNLSDKSKFATKICGLGIRKVYQKSGILEDLIKWALVRSNELNAGKSEQLLVLIDVLSTDAETKAVLKKMKFQHITTNDVDTTDKISNFGLNTFGVSLQVWGVALNVKSLKESDIKSLLSSKDFNKKDL
ncbi:hypothetical protein WICPIJ_004332 [Wickerhamomyces pijperi]|uniref:Inorganic phosphate transporter PHO86 n=1 Tax=Wickerhamomyces pijperi TaxID=599730 RepID=A0A9P8Q652_WICPI|nr:hypothetical protein WICPIJ_004332 [Wickerhamomyces pijperi]